MDNCLGVGEGAANLGFAHDTSVAMQFTRNTLAAHGYARSAFEAAPSNPAEGDPKRIRLEATQNVFDIRNGMLYFVGDESLNATWAKAEEAAAFIKQRVQWHDQKNVYSP